MGLRAYEQLQTTRELIMINNLPKSLIESATKIIILNGRKKLTSPYGDNVFMSIRKGVYKESLEENIQDWFKSTGVTNPHIHQELSEEHHSSLTDDEKRAVYAYTYNSTPIHNHIENSIVDDFHIKDDAGNIILSSKISHLDSAISKNKLSHEMVTYSGVSPLESITGHMHNKTYTSSSVDPLVAHKFASEHMPVDGVYHIIKIHNRKGDVGLYVGHNHELTASPNEFEYIIPRNSNFYLNPQPEEVRDNNNKLTHKIWSAYRVG